MPRAASSPRKTPRSAWNSLGKKAQFALVRRLIRTRGEQLKSRHHEILSVGIGYKTKAGDVQSTVCVGFLVRRKLKHVPGTPVPRSLYTYVQRKGQRRRCEVPTDVEELGRGGGPQSGINVASGVTALSSSNATSGINGAICCIAQEVGDARNRYLIGCHHVLARSKSAGECAASTSVVKAATGGVVGRLFDVAALAPGGTVSVDAAIALVPPAVNAMWQFETLRPLRVASAAVPPSNCGVYTPRGFIVPATFIKLWRRVPLGYSCGTVVIDTAYQFRAATIPGDSGSPVMSPDGTLHGMHFWGNVRDQMAYAIPAFVLFRPRLFSVPLRLV